MLDDFISQLGKSYVYDVNELIYNKIIKISEKTIPHAHYNVYKVFCS